MRTWAARGTLHLLPADDLPLWVAAMSTRNRETKGSWLKYHGVTAAQMQDIVKALPDVLGGTPMTRDELAAAIIGATGHEDLRGPLTQGFGAILKPLAFRGLLCSGPPRGRNVTFVAPRDWLGTCEPPPADEAIDALALRLPGRLRPGRAGGVRALVRSEAAAGQEVVRPAAPRLDPAGEFGYLPADAPAEAAGHRAACCRPSTRTSSGAPGSSTW